ncbi:Phox homologous domain [Phytophthora cactorum]|nr:Phox homologous domain [Phytophthora cactorum]
MNSYFVPEPNSTGQQEDPQIAEFEKRGNCKNYTLKTLADCVRQELPLRVSVSSTTKKDDYVVYNCTVSSVTTKNAWGVSYRYSEFLAFRNKVEELWTCEDKDCCGSCQAIRDVMQPSSLRSGQRSCRLG